MVGPQPHRQPWTPADDDQLRAMLEAGMSTEKIARKLRRTVAAIYTRAKTLKKMRDDKVEK
jgi:hypothetical protein